MKAEDLPDSHVFAEFNPKGKEESDTGLPELCERLLTRQMLVWPKLKNGYEAVASSRIRKIDCGDFSVSVQFNPQRIVSSGARVDPASISARPCFLCPAHLPEEQQGILYRRKFLILCNPFPIFPRHFTINDLDHRPQSLETHLETLPLLVRDLAPSLSLFYNGPQCGASAPDHLHFQACPAGSLPVESQLDDGRPLLPLMNYPSASISRVENLGRTVLVIESPEADALIGAVRRILKVMKTSTSGEEPMLNLHASFKEGKWLILFFPRRKNRPDLYDLQEPDRLLISPGSAEMGGLLVAPVERDFLRLTPEIVRHIYREVSVDPSLLKDWGRRLSLMTD